MLSAGITGGWSKLISPRFVAALSAKAFQKFDVTVIVRVDPKRCDALSVHGRKYYVGHLFYYSK